LNENIHVPVEQSEADNINSDCFEVNLVEAMKALKEEQRLSIDLFYKQEKSYVQIAQETQWELNKVKSYIQNAKRNLKILLENMCNGK
jgi:RNA polymerase sigma-70 factor (ECF subfamily)